MDDEQERLRQSKRTRRGRYRLYKEMIRDGKEERKNNDDAKSFNGVPSLGIDCLSIKKKNGAMVG